jgi:hypothetical protein
MIETQFLAHFSNIRSCYYLQPSSLFTTFYSHAFVLTLEIFSGNHHREKRHESMCKGSNSINFHQMLPMRYVKIMRMKFWGFNPFAKKGTHERMKKYLQRA